MKKNLNLNFYLLCFFVLAVMPLIYLSLNTPFALIDDYSDWLFIKDGFSTFLYDQTVGAFELSAARNRPVFAFLNYFNFFFFGDNPWLHHLLRWFIKVATFLFSWKVLQLVAPIYIVGEKNKDNNILCFIVMLFLWFFYPNSPDARLAPVELELAFFLSALIYLTIKIILIKNISKVSAFTVAGLYFSFLGLVFSKETGFAFALTSISILVISNYIWNKSNGRNWLILSPAIVFSSWSTYATIWRLMHGATPYGNSGLDAIKSNIHEFYISTLLSQLNINLPFILLAPILFIAYVLITKFRKAPTGYFKNTVNLEQLIILTFLFLELLTAIVMALLSPYACVRYMFPFLVPFIILSGIGIGFILQQFPGGTSSNIIGIVSCYFVICVYGLTSYQYGVQYSSRNAEKLFLNGAVGLARENNGIISIHAAATEFEDKVITYMNEYREKFYSDKSASAKGGAYFGKVNAYRLISDVPEDPGILIAEYPYIESNIVLFSKKLSRIFGSTDYYYLDCGATKDSQWLIYRK